MSFHVFVAASVKHSFFQWFGKSHDILVCKPGLNYDTSGFIQVTLEVISKSTLVTFEFLFRVLPKGVFCDDDSW